MAHGISFVSSEKAIDTVAATTMIYKPATTMIHKPATTMIYKPGTTMIYKPGTTMIYYVKQLEELLE